MQQSVPVITTRRFGVREANITTAIKIDEKPTVRHTLLNASIFSEANVAMNAHARNARK